MGFIDRVGEENYNNFGTFMKIIGYNNNKDITVEFQDEHKARVHTQYKHFKNGGVKNPYDREVYGVGYIGEGKYKASEKDEKKTKAYNTWKNMMCRCYDPYEINKDKSLSYIECYVCEEWHNFQNFAEWFYKNYYEIENETICLDKDILFKGNKIYSPESCVFVPNRINTMLIKQSKHRGEYLIGVTWHKRYGVYEAKCSYLDSKGKVNRKYLGRFNSEFQAFYAYKLFKEEYIKQIADEYKDLIPEKLYNALYNWEVEIND